MSNKEWRSETDTRAKKAWKSVERKHKSARRSEEKKHLKDIVDDMNAGRKDPRDDYDYEDEE
jgi:hypothetical protein